MSARHGWRPDGRAGPDGRDGRVILNVLEILQRTERYFRDAGIDSARLDAEVLLAALLGIPRIQLYAGFDRPLTVEELDDFRALVRRRAKREPVAYIIGVREFHSLAFKVTPATLIPRPETEHVVDAAVEAARGIEKPRLLDVGTGSGAIAISWASEVPDGLWVATDTSPEALDVADENAERLGVGGRGALFSGDLFAPVLDLDPFDIVVSNPPYVATGEEVDPECRYEPEAALACGDDPLHFYRRLATGAPAVLSPGGRLILELPGALKMEICDLLPAELRLERVVEDLAGRPRVLVAVRGHAAEATGQALES